MFSVVTEHHEELSLKQSFWMKSCLKCTTETCLVACISSGGEEGVPGRCPRGFWWLENQGRMHTLTPYHLCASQAGISVQSRNVQICFFLPTIFVQTAEDLSLLSFHFVSWHEGCTDTCPLKNGFILPSGLGDRGCSSACWVQNPASQWDECSQWCCPASVSLRH